MDGVQNRVIPHPYVQGQGQLLSHNPANANVAPNDELLNSIEARLHQMGDLPEATVERQIELLKEFASLDFGNFVLKNHGLNAYWTHQLVTYNPETADNSKNALEVQIYEKLPTVLATRERFGIFRQQLQALLQSGLSLASVPCGLMGDLLLLDYSQHHDIKLIGIDLDLEALSGAHAEAQLHGLTSNVSLYQEDAWDLSLKEEVDILVSNGLNIYEPDDERVTELYLSFFNAIKPGGKLITSFLTPPITVSAESSWNMTELDPAMLSLQSLLFVRLSEVKWSSFRTHEQTKVQLQNVGFTDITFINDRAGLFPTVIANKPT
jgi:hypothetical protein